MDFYWTANEAILVGGYNSSLAQYDDTWALQCSVTACNWTNVTAGSGGIAASWMSISSDTYAAEPIVFGGYDFATSAASNATWVLQNQTRLFANLSDQFPELGQSIALNATLLGGAFNGAYPDAVFSVWALGRSGGPVYFYCCGNQTITPPLAGTWYLNATALDDFDVAATASWVIQVGVPTASANVSRSATDVGVPVGYTSSLGGSHTPTGIRYDWSFGDGSRALVQNPRHAFASPGTYTAEVNVTDALNNSAYANVSVTVNPVPTATAHASAQILDTNGTVGLSATVVNGTSPFSYLWSFGDGSQNSTDAAPSHSYSASGGVVVRLWVTDAAGSVAESNLSVQVNPPLTAIAHANASSATVGDALTFSSEGSGGSGTYLYIWHFGDGSAPSSSAVSSHAYSVAGNFTATVWVNDTLGSSVVRHVAVSIRAPVPTNHGPSSTGSGNALPSWAWIAIALVIIAALIGSALLLRGRGGAGPPEGPPAPWVEENESAKSGSPPRGPPPGATG